MAIDRRWAAVPTRAAIGQLRRGDLSLSMLTEEQTHLFLNRLDVEHLIE